MRAPSAGPRPPTTLAFELQEIPLDAAGYDACGAFKQFLSFP
jgi:hypothetical protein